MSKKDEVAEDKGTEFDVMPGADRIDDEPETLDLSFTSEEAPETKEEVEEVVSEDEAEEESTAEEPEEVVAEDEAEDEDEAEPVEEPVAEAEPEPEPVEEPVAEEKSTKKPMVPKARLDEVLAKQKDLQKQLDGMKSAQVPPEDAPESFDFATKEVDYQNAVLDGEAEKAAQLRAEIRQAERTQIEYEMTQKMTQTVSQNQEATALQQAAAELERSFPVFDKNSSEYSEEMTNEVIELRDAFMIKGENAVAALSKAARFVVNDNGLVGDEPAPTLAGKQAPTEDEVAKKRKEVSKKLKAADAQPPELPGESSAARGEKSFDVSSMTEEEFDALPEATLKRLRGDIL